MRLMLLVVLALLASGCYHATVETGLAPSAQTLEEKWASGWVYGLVPPSTVETMERCPSGVARVETQLSFANQLVSFLTAGIYTPMSIEVTCAAADAQDGALVTDRQEWQRAMDGGEPFFVDVDSRAR